MEKEYCFGSVVELIDTIMNGKGSFAKMSLNCCQILTFLTRRCHGI